ncbi:MAG: glycoside hydrolase family 13 protein [Oscillospiraceae bacterium]|nr:glycoside hydrolase family 13 protein [Oscillospiraceae bacterium]
MLLQHQPLLPFCCYDKAIKKIVIRIVCGKELTPVTVIYGDPYNYRESGRLDKAGNKIWDWAYEEAAPRKQYSDSHQTVWQAELPTPRFGRMKYAFILEDENGKALYYGDNGLMEDTVESKNDPHNQFFLPYAHGVDALDIPQWAGDVVWYQIFPERFCNGNPSISPVGVEDWETGESRYDSFFGGDLYGIIEKLPYIKALGATGLYLTPIFKSPTTHKYTTQDYFTVDEHFGDKETLKNLVSKAHELGMKVMLDAVFNHIGSKHMFWQDVLANQENSQYKDYFHIHSFPVLESYEDRNELNYDTYGFYHNMPKWNTENPAARKYLIEAALYWIRECGIDGWRLDASDDVSFSFWREFKSAITAYKKDFYILGEIWYNPSKWLDNGYFDAVTNYSLSREIRDFFLGKNPNPDEFTRKLFGKITRYSDMHSRIQLNLMDSHDTARVLTQADGNKLALKNAFLFMFLMRGAPCLYYGTEIGMEGANDPDCRRPMIWDKKRQDLELLEFFKRLIALRKEHNILVQNAAVSYTTIGGLCCWTLAYGGEEVDIMYNSGSEEVEIKADILLATHTCENNALPAKTIAVCSSKK